MSSNQEILSFIMRNKHAFLEKIGEISINQNQLVRIMKKRRRKLRLLMRNNLFALASICLKNTCNRSIWVLSKNGQLWESAAQKYSDKQFKREFRVSKQSFRKLVSIMRCMGKEDTNYRCAISISKRIAIAMYALGSSAEYRTVANVFGVGRTTVGEIVLEFCQAVWTQMKPIYLNVYPLSREKMIELIAGFEAIGFPQCLGAIDGCHFEVSPTKEEATDFYNYKGWYSIILLAAVDYRYRFTFISAGAPGRCNDSFLFENSSLKRFHATKNIFAGLSKRINNVSVPPLLISDSAFRLSKLVMKPYPFVVARIPKAKKEEFNYQLSRARCMVEKTFGHVKARFRKAGKGLQVNVENAQTIIKACCVLHNFLNDENDMIWQSWIREYQRSEPRGRPQPTQGNFEGETDIEGVAIRNALANNFYERLLMEEGAAVEDDADNGEESSA